MIGYFASLYLDRRFPLSHISFAAWHCRALDAGGSLPIKINVNASMVRAEGVEPSILTARGLKSRVYTNSTTPAYYKGLGLKSRRTPLNFDFGGLSWSRTMLSRLTVLRSTDELIAQIAV